MKKRLDNPTLTSELREGSVFFRRPGQPAPAATPAAEPAARQAPQQAPVPSRTQSTEPKPTQENMNGSVISRNRDVMTSRYTDELIEGIRKNVRAVGREPGTIRLTEQEKVELTDIIYTLGRQGNRTSENEIYRIGLNFLLADWREHGQESLLARVLAALRA